MDAHIVREKLCEVLGNIQALSGLDCPKLTGSTRPANDLPKFDSKIWPVAIGMLATALGIAIANDVNIFRVKGTKLATTIDEAVNSVCSLATSPVAVAAE